jgi:mannose/cellobiose epimerase-like protein (N-acyl-D-glucosamine 2-epimerase family)
VTRDGGATGTPSPWPGLPTHRAWLDAEATRLIDFARRSRVPGGFGWLDDRGEPESGRPLQLWITTRMTHVFALGDLLGHPGCGALADHGLVAIRETFEDREHGGWYPEVAADGPVRTDKEAYPHAFVLLAAASAAIAGRRDAEALLETAVSVVETRFWSEAEGAMMESWDRSWREPEPYRGANANMHMVEALLAAGDATRDPVWYDRARRIAERIIDRVARGRDWRIVEHFDAGWRPLPDYNADNRRHPFRPFGVTPGHGFEWSRLLLQIAAGLPAPPDWLLEASRGLFARALDDGWLDPGGFVYTTGLDGRPVVTDRLHWVVCEAIGAAAALHSVTGDAEYERQYRRAWDFAALHLIDRGLGSWHAELDDALRPSSATWSGKPDVYHALQAALLPRLPVAPSLAGLLRDLPPS